MEDLDIEVKNAVINVHLASADEVRCMMESLAILHHKLESIMSAISDFAVKQKAHNDKIASDLDALGTSIDKLNALIATLQQSPGQLSPDDAATLDQIDSAGQALADKADKLAGVVPPTPPTA